METYLIRVVLSWYTFTLGKNSQLVRNHSWKILPTAIFYQLPFLTNWAGKCIPLSPTDPGQIGKGKIFQVWFFTKWRFSLGKIAQLVKKLRLDRNHSWRLSPSVISFQLSSFYQLITMKYVRFTKCAILPSAPIFQVRKISKCADCSNCANPFIEFRGKISNFFIVI